MSFIDGERDEFSYNKNGQLISAKNSNHEISFTYDEYGKLITESQNGVDIGYEYNQRGFVTHIHLPNGKTIHHQINGQNQLKAILYSEKLVGEFIYDANGLELSQSMGKLEQLKEYDFMGRLTQQAAYKQGIGRSPITRRSYAYQNDGKLESVDDLKRGK